MPLKQAEDFVGTILADRYKLIELLGTGGMGAVYRAEHMHLECIRAVKLLLPEHVDNESLVKRFHREARGLSRLHHPNVVKVVDTGQSSDGLPFIAMEFLEGEPLTATLKRHGRLPWPIVKRIARQVCSALHAAHEAGIIHRDIKPDNCFRVDGQDDEFTIKLLDFGIARIERGEQVTKLTKTGSVMGTLHYMSYEQVSGQVCGRASDVWSVAVMFYELLSGKLPFRGSNMGQIFFAIVQHEPPPVSHVAGDAQLPAELDDVLARALEKDASRRYNTMLEFLEALEAVPDARDAALAQTLPASVYTHAQGTANTGSRDETQIYQRSPKPVRGDEKTQNQQVAGTDLYGQITGEQTVAPVAPAKQLTADHEVRPTPTQSKKRPLVILAGSAGLTALAILGWALTQTDEPTQQVPAIEVQGDVHSDPPEQLTTSPDATATDATTGNDETGEPEPTTSSPLVDEDTNVDPTTPKEVENPPATKKSKKRRRPKDTKKDTKKAPAEPKPPPKVRSLKERTTPEVKKLEGLLKTHCSSNLSPGDAPKAYIRIHRTGAVEFVDWDAKSKVLFQATGVEVCVKRVIKGFRVPAGSDPEESVKRLIAVRK